MAASQVVLYFDKQDDALLFTLAASSVISEAPVRAKEALVKIADEIRKASRIRTHGVLNPSEPSSKEPVSKEKEKRVKPQEKEQRV